MANDCSPQLLIKYCADGWPVYQKPNSSFYLFLPTRYMPERGYNMIRPPFGQWAHAANLDAT